MTETGDSDYPKAVAAELADLDRYREKVMECVKPCRVAEEAIQALELKNTEVSIGWFSTQLKGVLIKVHFATLDDIARLLKWLAQRGYRQTGEPEDYAEIHRRTWECGDIKVSGFFEEGSKCQFVQVGVKETPVYDLRCESKAITNG